jgi:hypothetical protein
LPSEPTPCAEPPGSSVALRTHPDTQLGTRFVRPEIIFLCIVIVLCAAIRWRLRDMPLERDEGEYAYAGRLILQGIPPYQLAYNMKLPGTYVAYATVMALFGQTSAAIRVGLLGANSLTIILLYLLSKLLFGSLAGTVTGATYGLLSLGPWTNGFAGHATHFVVLPVVAGFLLLFIAIDTYDKGRRSDWKLFSAGFLLGLAFVMKQPGAAFGVFAVVYLVWPRPKPISIGRRLIVLCAGGVLPFALTCLWLWHAGVINKFWFWTFSYAAQYGTAVGAAEGWSFFLGNFSRIFFSAPALWILATIGLLVLVWNRRARAHSDFMVGLLVFSALPVSAGLYFRGHYFILLLPAISLLAGLAISSARDWLDCTSRRSLHHVPSAIFVAAFALSLFQQRFFLFHADPVAASRYVYPNDPFPEAATMGNYIQQHSLPSDRIAVIGSEPQIMFYAQRRSVTGYLYGYSLTEEQKYASTMQREMISEVEAGRPAYAVLALDWVIRPRSDRTILAWADKYLAENYDLIGFMRVGDAPQMRAPSDLRTTPGNLAGALFLFQRKTGTSGPDSQ